MEDRQANHQSNILEAEDEISIKYVSILIDFAARLSYIALRLLEKCKLRKEKKKMHGWYN